MRSSERITHSIILERFKRVERCMQRGLFYNVRELAEQLGLQLNYHPHMCSLRVKWLPDANAKGIVVGVRVGMQKFAGKKEWRRWIAGSTYFHYRQRMFEFTLQPLAKFKVMLQRRK